MKRSHLFSLTVIVLGLASSAQAQFRVVETMTVLPTSSIVGLPRTYYVPTSYIVPTSYVSSTSVIVPTSTTVYDIAPTAYVYQPTTYVSTSYLRYRPGRVVERTYYRRVPSRLTPTYYVSPTSYLLPTTVVTESSLVASSTGMCCGSEIASSAPVTPVAPPAKETATTKSVESTPATDRGVIDSTVRVEDDEKDPLGPAKDEALKTTNGSASAPAPREAVPSTPPNTRRDLTSNPPISDTPPVSSKVDPAPSAPISPAPVAKSPAATTSPAATNPAPKPAPPAAVTTPVPAVSKPAAKPDPKAIDPKTSIPPPKSSAVDPIAPSVDEPPPVDGLPFPDLKAEETNRRSAQKPVYSNTAERALRNVLQGKIVSADNLKPEEGVQVVLTDRTGRFLDRTTKTDTKGMFALSLPEGDWAIKVTMPSGRVVAVDQGVVTATAGRVLDRYGRDLKNLIIQR
jgi:hypothetical protein